MHGPGQAKELAFGDGINLRAIEFWSENGELVGAHIEVLRVESQQRLIAQTGAARIAGLAKRAVIAGLQVIDRPGRCGIA